MVEMAAGKSSRSAHTEKVAKERAPTTDQPLQSGFRQVVRGKSDIRKPTTLCEMSSWTDQF